MKYILICDGAGASSRDFEDLLLTIIGGYNHKRQVWHIDHTLFEGSTRKALKRFFNRLEAGDEVFIFCKSQGAWRVLDFLMHHRYPHTKVKMLSVDPHHWANGIRKVFHRPKLKAVNVPCINIYQNKYWPKGCFVAGAQNIFVEDSSFDHGNIVHHPTVAEVLKSLFQ